MFARGKIVFYAGKSGGGSDVARGEVMFARGNMVFTRRKWGKVMFARGSRTVRECYFIFWCLKFGLAGELLSDF